MVRLVWRTLLLLLMICVMLFLVPSGPILLDAQAETLDPSQVVPLPIDLTPGHMPDMDLFLPDDAGYEDPTIRVTIEKARAYDTDILVARVEIAHPSQLRTAFAGRYGSDATTAGGAIARRHNAVFSINGDFYSYNTKGFMVRQGKVYRKRPTPEIDTLIIDENGDFMILLDTTMEQIEAFSGTMVNTFSFGPALVVDGELSITEKYEDPVAKKQTQRMAIAQTGPLSYLCVATEGPENTGSVGLTLTEFATFVYELGCEQAYNLDGGSSSTMTLHDRKINALSTRKVRPISDIIYFSTGIPADVEEE